MARLGEEEVSDTHLSPGSKGQGRSRAATNSTPQNYCKAPKPLRDTKQAPDSTSLLCSSAVPLLYLLHCPLNTTATDKQNFLPKKKKKNQSGTKISATNTWVHFKVFFWESEHWMALFKTGSYPINFLSNIILNY